ncbi:MAG: hypothetical protein HQK86_01545 [Nitrospinae bacterium]|nr:hypothetical protein [Nitrospinota bacterium]
MAVLLLVGCGGGGGGGSAESPAVSSSPSDKLLANFIFQYNLSGTDYDARYTITGPTDKMTDDGNIIYRGFDADYQSLLVVAAWYPSLNRYVALGETGLYKTYRVFSFIVEGDNRLTGCYDMMVNDQLYNVCVPLNSATSHRYSSGAWSRVADSLARTPGGDDNIGMTSVYQRQEGVSAEYATAVADLARHFAPVGVE